MARYRFIRRQRGSAHAAGFTLVELMVSMTGGLFLAIFVVALSRDASRFYQRESRIASATLGGVAGFERLSNDVARAGHMSTPNIVLDPRVCNRPDATWPAALQTLRAIGIQTADPSVAGTEVAAAGISPSGIVVTGALDAPEELYTNTVEPAANSFRISLNMNTPAALRLGLSTATSAAANNLAVLQAVFMVGNVGRIVRLRKEGSEQYGVVASVETTDTMATVVLAPNPALQFRVKGNVVQCGIIGVGAGYSLSVINMVHYNLRSMVNNAAYAALFLAANPGGNIPHEASRTELTREELNPAGAPIPNTLEIVAEYAVDLQVTPWSATSVSNPVMSTTALATQFPTTAGTTELLRGMHLRLTIRSREADREKDVPASTGPNHYRFKFSETEFARTRTFQADVPFRNLENAYW